MSNNPNLPTTEQGMELASIYGYSVHDMTQAGFLAESEYGFVWTDDGLKAACTLLPLTESMMLSVQYQDIT